MHLGPTGHGCMERTSAGARARGERGSRDSRGVCVSPGFKLLFDGCEFVLGDLLLHVVVLLRVLLALLPRAIFRDASGPCLPVHRGFVLVARLAEGA